VVWWVTEPGKDHAAKLAAEFEKENPDIKVKLQTNPYGGLQNKVLIALRSGIPPDVIEVQTSWIAPYVATGKLADVGDVIAGKLDLKDFVPAAIQSGQYQVTASGVIASPRCNSTVARSPAVAFGVGS